MKNGESIDKDLYQAFTYYSKSAELGYRIAEIQLYEMMYYGQGCTQNKEKAVESLRRIYLEGGEDADLAQIALFNLEEYESIS